MPITDLCFKSFVPGGFPHPLLPIKIINTHAKKGGPKIRPAYGLVDTGAMSCAIPAYMAKMIGHNYKKGIKTTFTGAGGEGDSYLHETRIEIVVPGTDKIVIPAAMINYIEGLPNVLLGVSGFLERFILKIDYPRHLLSIKKSAKYVAPYTTP